MELTGATREQLQAWQNTLSSEYSAIKEQGLSLDLTRGKPSAEQLSLSNTLDGILNGDYRSEDGTDVRNYGGLEGLPEARALFAQILGTPSEETFVGGLLHDVGFVTCNETHGEFAAALTGLEA